MIFYPEMNHTSQKRAIVHVRQEDGYYHFHYVRGRDQDIIDDYSLPIEMCVIDVDAPNWIIEEWESDQNT